MNNGYKAGNLSVELLGVSSKATSSIDKVVTKLNNLNTTINAIDVGKFATLSSSITAMGNAFQSFNLKNLSSLSTRLNNFGKKMASMDFTTIQKGFANLTSAITPFIDKITTAENSLRLLNEMLTKVSGRKLKGLSNFGLDSGTRSSSKKGGFGLLNLAKWTGVFYMARRVGRVISTIVQSGADYTETLNLWETAMGSNLNVATEFVNKMNEAYGISEKTLMNAQAIFKNMLGSLGQISDTMAYSLSEGITQMALDYASLYNQTFEQAFTKFQAALAGQVRPIRSVAGYDITENTLYQLYQSLGGTKTMRQLTRTEKQLLSILAIFNQMTASGAVGDLDKTMSSFANQSRVWKESLVEVKNWLGVILTYTIQESGIMVKLNAMLITVARYLEAVAKQIGAIQHFENDPFAGTEQSAIDASKAVDELQGKLLDFDKFRSLSGAEENALGLDEKLLNALSGYDTILGNASNEARKMSDEWFRTWGFIINANGELELTDGQLQTAKDKINSIINFLKGFDGKGTLEAITPLMSSLLTTLKELLPIITTLSQVASPIFIGIIKIIGSIVETLDTLGLLKVAILAILSYKLATKIMGVANNISKLHKTFLQPFMTYLSTQSTTTLPLATKSITSLQYATSALTGVLGYLVGDMLLSNLGEDAKSVVAPIMLAVGAVTSLVMAILALRGVMSMGTALPFITAGIGVAIAGVKGMLQVDNYANGGLPDKGTLFRAGEAGAEIVYNTPSGQSGVVNVQQIAQATRAGTLQAVKEWWSQARNDIPQFREVSKTGIYEVAKSEMRRRGEW